MLTNILVALATFAACYLLLAVMIGADISVAVVRDMRREWPKWTPLQCAVFPFLIGYHGLKAGSQWPCMLVREHKRRRALVDSLKLRTVRLERKLAPYRPTTR